GSVAAMELTGSGFDNTSTVELIAADNTTTYSATGVTLDTPTQLSATLDLTGVPQGTYAVRVTRADSATSQLSAAFSVTAPGEAHFESHLILPSAMGFHISSTLYVEYSNTGNIAMPAPLLVLGSTQTDNKPLLTLDSSLVVSGSWTSAIPQGYSNTVQILAS